MAGKINVAEWHRVHHSGTHFSFEYWDMTSVRLIEIQITIFPFTVFHEPAALFVIVSDEPEPEEEEGNDEN